MAVSQSHWKLRESGRQHQSRSITSAALFPAAPPAHRCNKSMSIVLIELPSKAIPSCQTRLSHLAFE